MTVAAPYERLPLFIKAGSILPIGPEIEYTGQKPDDPIILYVYTGADARFTLYEDEGTNYNYENGEYATIEMTYQDATGEFTIGERKGDFPGMLKERTFQVTFVSKDKPRGFAPTKNLT